MELKDAVNIKEKLRHKGLQATLLALNEISPNSLIQFPGIDVFVNTGCPRLSLDDAPHFSKPLLSINETMVMLGEMKWETLLKNGWFGNEI